MIKHKYVKTANNEIIVFPLRIQHDTFEYLNPVSAGFITILKGNVTCNGRSETLCIDSHCDDTEIATKQFRGY